ncbi:MAG: O-antigen ligase family protein, partial [Bacteroidales bacterium]|nr:O-antigen ligase family protein [Bacteroidales bacterium]
LQNAPYFGGIILSAALCGLLCIWQLFKAKSIRISRVDMALFIFVGYTCCNSFVRQGGISPKLLIEVSILVLLYIAVRLADSQMRNGIIFLLLIAAITQAIYGQLQLYGLYSSHHALFNITGSFFNPAPYAGYLCALFPIALVLYRDKSKVKMSSEERIIKTYTLRLLQLVPLIAIVLIIIVLPATRSRAAWIGLAFSTVLLLLKESPRCHSYRDQIKSLSLQRCLALISLFLLLIGFLSFIYFLKKDSADGRLLIWKIALNMVHEKPMLGWGYNGFEAFFMNAQADFFREHPQHLGIALADNVQYAYNEFFKLIIEHGLVGLVLMITSLILLLSTKSKETNVKASQWGITALVIFSLFSYPSDILVIKLVFVLYLGIVSSGSSTVFSVKRRGSIAVLLIAIISLALLIPEGKKVVKSYYAALVSWRDASDIYRIEAYEECLDDFELVYPVLETDGDFLVQYGKALTMAGQYKEAINVLENAKTYLNNTILYTALGDSYAKTGNYDEAEKAYYHAYYMVPSRFYPLYLLAKMFDTSEQHDKATAIANTILDKSVKVDSKAIEEIRAYALELIETKQ